MKVVIAGGGTAGHVNPAIALGRALSDAEVTFVGTAAGANDFWGELQTGSDKEVA